MSSPPYDCKIQVRKYILTSRALEWSRETVQSPFLDLSKVGWGDLVPVRRFQTPGENTVRCIQRRDIEKDSAGIYQKQAVSSFPASKYAHGVAIFASQSKDSLEYQPGDKFWICIGPNTKEYGLDVPVVNLRTSQQGTVTANQVCWFPTVQGPGGELWTLAGQKRKLKLGGADNYKTFSWVVCQRLDGASPSTKHVEIPTKGTEMADRRRLPASESLSFFDQVYAFRFGNDFVVASAPSNAIDPQNSNSLISPTPPTSPELNTKVAQKFGYSILGRHINESLNQQFNSTEEGDMDALWRVVKAAKHAQRTIRNSGQSEPDAWDAEASSSDTMDTEYEIERMETDVSENGQHLDIRETYNDTTDIGSILSPHAIDSQNRPAFSPTDPRITTGKMNIFAICGVYKPRYNHLVDNLCRSEIPGCEYNTIATCLHFHSPPDKCRRMDQGHNHCISRLGPAPAAAGGCLLQGRKSMEMNHSCCKWAAEGFGEMPVYRKPEFNDSEVVEAKRLGLRVSDLSGWSKKQAAVDADVNLEESGIWKGGIDFWRSLMGGDLDGEVNGLSHDMDLDAVEEEPLYKELGGFA